MIFSKQETSNAIRSMDWSTHPLGPVELWPEILRNTLNMILNTNNPVFIFWGDENYCFYNDGYIPILGKGKHPSVLGQPGKAAWPEIWKDYTYPELEKALAGNSTWNVDQFIPVFRNGETSEAYFTYGYSPIYLSGGKIGGVLVIATETTEKVLAQRELQSVFTQSPVGICVLKGPEHVFFSANDSYFELLGRNREIIGLPIRKALPDIEGQGFYELLDNVFETGKPFIGKEVPASVDLEDGKKKHFYTNFTYSPKFDSKGKIEGIIAVVYDITSSVETRLKVESLANELSEALSSRDEFLSIASHELLTPITSLKLQLQMMMKGTGPEERMFKTLNSSNRQVDRLTLLINDLLDVSRMESGRMNYDFVEENPSLLVQEVSERYAEQILASGSKLTLNLDASLVVRCDRFRLEQVIINLLSNALKYGNGNNISITTSRDSHFARIIFTDNGIGIDQVNQEKIFDRFERAVSNKNISGLGLGLYISKQIVEAHSGKIILSSVSGSGSSFTVELPLKNQL